MVLKSDIKTIIADFHKEGIPKIIQRNYDIPLNSNKIITLIGPRRAGKTYMLYQLMAQVKDITDILYINFEDERLTFSQDDFKYIIEAYFELYPDKKNIYIFLDEIQETKGWEKFVRRIYDTITKNIFLTGSSAKLLSKEIATSLRGRAISYEIYPLSFKEYLRFKEIPEDIASTKGKAKITAEFEEYLLKGGFPETVNMSEDVHHRTLISYFDVMFYRDVIERYNISSPLNTKDLLKHLLSQSAKEFSINKIYNDLKSRKINVSKDSLYNYLNYFEDAFIILLVSNYSESARKTTLRKSYAIDSGLARKISLSLSKDHGRLLETAILLELRRRGKKVAYFKNGGECDLIILDGNKVTGAIQVCYELNNENKEREFKGLRSAMKRFSLKSGIIITASQEKEEDNIKIVPATKWLLEKQG